MLNELQILSITYREMNSEQRQRFGLSRSDNSDFLREIITDSLFDAFSVLYTSNRLEFHFLACTNDKLSVCTEIARHLDQTAYIDVVNQLMKFSHYVGDYAIWYLLRVACGLDSEILGEKHIAAQLKKSISEMLSIHKSEFFHRLLNYIVRQSNQIRKLSGLDLEQKSTAGILLEIIRIYSDNPKILFVGLNNETQTFAIKLHEKLFRNIQIISDDSLQIKPVLNQYLCADISCTDYDIIIHSTGEIPDTERFNTLRLFVTFGNDIMLYSNNFKLITKQDLDKTINNQYEQIQNSALIAENLIANLTFDHQLFFS